MREAIGGTCVNREPKLGGWDAASTSRTNQQPNSVVPVFDSDSIECRGLQIVWMWHLFSCGGSSLFSQCRTLF